MNDNKPTSSYKTEKTEAFKKTEKLLSYYAELKEHLENEKEYIEMIYRQKSKSVITYSKNSCEKDDEDLRIEKRIQSYERSCADIKRIEKALQKEKNKKGYEVIEKRFLEKKEEGEHYTNYTYEEIAEILAGNGKYSPNLNEKTVRRYKNKIIEDISIILFGLDAIEEKY